MIMKKIFNIYKNQVVMVAVMLATLMTSCTDYLTIIPPDKIVHEHFWQTKDEVNGMMATSYLKLVSGDAVSKAIIWGELRADNMKYPANYNKEIKYIVEANLLDDNSYSRWGIYYEAINYANLVIEYAPLVVDRDPDFTEGDLEVVLGEMYAMRALCHFYLVRTFRDIPMALKPAVNDAELPDYNQVHPLQALDHIMADLDLAENMVMKTGNFTTPESNYGRITKNAVLAMKADVNLWRAAFATYYEGTGEYDAETPAAYYDLCIQNCQTLLDNMDKQFQEDNKDKPVFDDYPYHLITNMGEVNDLKKTKRSTAYNSIFGSMNSRESIFELQVEGDNVKNGYCYGIYNVFGSEGNPGAVVVPSNFMSNYQTDDLRRFSFTNTPIASTAGENKNDICIAKYTAASSPATDYRKTNQFDANWIVYRKTDVMLMMAEALVANTAATPEDIKQAFNLVKVINTRSRIDSTKITNPLVESRYTDRNACLELVLKERALELSFEGKRWYDLVRKALREKTTNNITFVADKLDSNSGVVKSKMSTIDGLFFPIHIDELRYNKLLKQNPAYDGTSSSTTEMVK